MPRKFSATQDQWIAIGRKTYLARLVLFDLCKETGGRKMPVFALDMLFRRCIGWLDKFRSRAEDEMFRQHARESWCNISVFYPAENAPSHKHRREIVKKHVEQAIREMELP